MQYIYAHSYALLECYIIRGPVGQLPLGLSVAIPNLPKPRLSDKIV